MPKGYSVEGKCPVCKNNFLKCRITQKYCSRDCYIKVYTKEKAEYISNWQKEYRINNKEKIIELDIKYRTKNRDILNKKKKIYRDNNKEKIALKKKEIYYRDVEKSRAKDRERYHQNKKDPDWLEKRRAGQRMRAGRYRKKTAARLRERERTDINYKIKKRCQQRVRAALKYKDVKKTLHTFELIGCTPQFLKQYLESQFTEGMSWDNHGVHGWHIDHIIPCISFNLSKESEQKKCFHYTNLQPLWAKDNLEKMTQLNWSKEGL